jgi:hypothetical protein
MDFFTVPTLSFGILYCFFVIGHDRRRVLHHNVTCNPKRLLDQVATTRSLGCGQQPLRFLIFDRDAKFRADVVSTVKADLGGFDPTARFSHAHGGLRSRHAKLLLSKERASCNENSTAFSFDEPQGMQ